MKILMKKSVFGYHWDWMKIHVQFLIVLQLFVVVKSIETVEIAGATDRTFAEMMVGRSVSFTTEKNPPQPKEVILSIKDLVDG